MVHCSLTEFAPLFKLGWTVQGGENHVKYDLLMPGDECMHARVFALVRACACVCVCVRLRVCRMC